MWNLSHSMGGRVASASMGGSAASAKSAAAAAFASMGGGTAGAWSAMLVTTVWMMMTLPLAGACQQQSEKGAATAKKVVIQLYSA